MFSVKTTVKIEGEKVSSIERGDRVAALRAIHSAKVQSSHGKVTVLVKDPDGRITKHVYRDGAKLS